MEGGQVMLNRRPSPPSVLIPLLAGAIAWGLGYGWGWFCGWALGIVPAEYLGYSCGFLAATWIFSGGMWYWWEIQRILAENSQRVNYPKTVTVYDNPTHTSAAIVRPEDRMIDFLKRLDDGRATYRLTVGRGKPYTRDERERIGAEAVKLGLARKNPRTGELEITARGKALLTPPPGR